MDETDLQIMRRMGVAPFLVWPHPPSSLRPSALGRSLKVSTDTVKRRLAALRQAKVFHGTMVFPNPRLLGLRMASFHFRQGASRRRVPPQDVARVEGVLGVFDMVGGDRCIDVAFGTTTARDRLLAELTHMLGAHSSHFVDYAAPSPGKLSPLDWRILQALRAGPDTTLEQAAQRLGVSGRTVKRRFDRMVEQGAVDVIGLFDPGAMAGHLLVDLVFHLAPGSGQTDAASIVNTFRSRWVAQWSPPDRRLGHLALVVVASSARELEDLRREGESLACVERCEALVVESARESWEWMDAAITARAGGSVEERAGKAAKPRKAVAKPMAMARPR
jgi:DNA-binding Lrp family transcriptional regulator